MAGAQLIRQATAIAVDCSKVADWSCQAGWDIEYHQVGRGAFDAWFSVASCRDMLFTNQFCNRDLIMSGCPPDKMVALVLPAGQRGMGVFEGKTLGATEGILLLPDSDRTLRSFTDSLICTVSVPRRRLDSILEPYTRNSTRLLSASRSVVFQQRVLRFLAETISGIAVSKEGSVSRAGMALLEDQLLQALADSLYNVENGREQQARGLANRRRHVDSARNYIEEHLEEAISIGRVAEHVNVTTRTLEFAFRDVLGVTPFQYLRCRRLNRIRKQLVGDSLKNRTIAWLAYENGFNHLGNFARDYKILFGELPSQTVACRKSFR